MSCHRANCSSSQPQGSFYPLCSSQAHLFCFCSLSNHQIQNFCAARAGLFLLERARAPHPGGPWLFVETPARRNSSSWLIPQSCPAGAFSYTLPASASRAARCGRGPWVMFLVSRHGRRLVLYLAGAPSSNRERKQATKGGALFWMEIPDCSHIGQVRPDRGNVEFLL